MEQHGIARKSAESDVFFVKSRIEAIKNAKEEQGLSVQQLADMCKISASTVSRTLTGKTEPTEYTITTMEEALGIPKGQTDDPILEATKVDPILERYINLQESRHTRMRAHYNMLITEKNRWIMMSFIMNLLLVAFICFFLICDILHPAIGWIAGR